jgi:hypothetical protein
MELTEIETALLDFWAVKQGRVKVPLAVGLLLRNAMIATRRDASYSWQRQRGVTQRYQITTEGKKFLTEAVQRDERIR